MGAPRIDKVEAEAIWHRNLYRVEIERMEEEDYESDDDDAKLVTKVWGLAQVSVVSALEEGDEDAPAEVEVEWGDTLEMVMAAIEKAASVRAGS